MKSSSASGSCRSFSSRRSSKVENTHDPNTSNLRRLKIQEKMLLKLISDNNIQFEPVVPPIKLVKEFQTTFSDMRNLLQEIKLNSESEDCEEIQRNITSLEEKIKTHDIYFHKQLNYLKKEEEVLSTEIEHKVMDTSAKGRTRPKKKALSLEDIVPSPVKTIMNTPFRNKAVQEYQDYLHKYKKYGGWIDYQHNVFVQIWNKHFNNNSMCSMDVDLDSSAFEPFLTDVMNKIQGVNYQDIKQHADWYKTLLILTKKQNKALEEWKERRNIKKTPSVRKKNDKCTDSKINIFKDISDTDFVACNEDLIDYVSDVNSSDFSRDLTSASSSHSSNACQTKEVKQRNKPLSAGILRPTKQWLNKCNSPDEPGRLNHNMNVEELCKMRTPNWRSKLLYH